MTQWKTFPIVALTAINLLPEYARGRSSNVAPRAATTANALQRAFDRAFKLLEAQDYMAALQVLTPAYARAVAENNRRFQLALLNSIGTAELGLHRNRGAIQTLTKAADLAAELDRPDTAAAIATNLSNLFARLGQLDLAYVQAMQAARQLPASAPAYYRVHLLLNIAEVNDAVGDRTAALAQCRSAVDAATRAGDSGLRADAQVRLAALLTRTGDLGEAERLLVDSIDVEIARGAPGLDAAYRNLGRLRIAQGRPEEAVALLDKSIARFEQGRSRLDGWHLYYDRGRARKLTGDVEGAFNDFTTSLAGARRWRAQIIPVDEVLTNNDVEVDQVVSALIETGMERYGNTKSSALAIRLFTACEENRALSLRQNRGWLARLPEHYWQLLARARALETKALSSGRAATADEVRTAWAEIARLETQAGLATPVEVGNDTARRTLETLRRHLRADEALISFYVGSTQSYVWALTANSFEVRPVGARENIAKLADTFTQAIMNGRDDWRSSGVPLHEALFGSLSKRVKQANEWVLSLDDQLFTVPFAALPIESQYLIEQRTLRIAPSAFVLTEAEAPPSTPTFLALSEPIYNRSDPRIERTSLVLASSERSHSAVFRSQGGTQPGVPLELARIPGSGSEAEGCARSWAAGPSTVLTGRNSRRTQLAAQLARRPSILHLSLHVVPASADQDAEAYIALGLGADGKPDFLTPSEIARFPFRVPVVIMSGCASGRGRALPGAGLTGLTRAWLLAGSRAVAASLWPTPDDTGTMFRAFYQYLSPLQRKLSARHCAQALRLAQLQMLRCGTWRAQPQYWAAFFLMGKD